MKKFSATARTCFACSLPPAAFPTPKARSAALWPAKDTARWLFRARPSTTSVYLVPEKVRGVPIFEEVRVNPLNLYGTFGITIKITLS